MNLNPACRLPRSRPAKRGQGTILYVEDDRSTRSAMAETLRDAGFQVLEAETACDAMRLAERKPDLILLDIELPEVDGFEVCRRIKTDPTTAGILVVHLSGAYVTSADKVRGLAGCADGFLTKPVDPHELVAHLKALLRVRHPAEEVRFQLAAVEESSQDAIVVSTLDDIVSVWNAGAERLFGYPARDARQVVAKAHPG